MANTLLPELTWRELVSDHTPGLPNRLAKGPITAYVGFDPTARSLQVGNLVPIMLLAHLQHQGGRPIVLLGRGTGMIGDPSGKSAERPLLDETTLAENTARQREQFARFLDFDKGRAGAVMLDNAEWLIRLNLVGFLRDVGKHFTLSYMLQKESVKSRLDAGISYTEFSYMLLQAYDFLELFRREQCEMQMGGSDQWGNITAGTELIRRVESREAHGLCAPLLATASGKKFGKTEEGSVWLDPDMTSPYKFYQFWVNADDRDVERFLKSFTFLPRETIADLMMRHAKDTGARVPHRALAADVTERVHGADVTRRVADASRLAFGELEPHEAEEGVLKTLAAELPSGARPAAARDALSVIELVTTAGLAKSKGEARRLIQQGGISFNGRRVTDAASTAADFPELAGGYDWLSRGKKQHFIFIAAP